MDWKNQIRNYNPSCRQEERDKEIALLCLDTYDNLLTRENPVIHVTSSAFIINPKGDRTLMVHHNIYNSWSWTGGHADGEEDLLSVALKEAKEETGIENIRVLNPDISSLDILPVLGHQRRGKYVAPHLHLSLSYLVEGEEEDPLIINKFENSAVKWVPLKKINEYSTEVHMHGLYEKLVRKTEKYLHIVQQK
ncbi:MAG: NUDIX hydrolase [Eubacteriaceae bacterium]|nr:NUDIX hydrolase [Eubacteriaceae bacterium]